MEAFTNKLTSIKNTVVDAFSGPTEQHTASKLEVLGLEEVERTRRLEQVSQSRVDKQNAASISHLISQKGHETHHHNFTGLSKGYKRVTTKWEEDERRRRHTNKTECAFRRANANKTALMIQGLGWPFIHNHAGAEYISMEPTRALEEGERVWRTNNSYWTATAKHNAAMVANILRWNNFQPNRNSGFRGVTRSWEEKERNYRLQGDVFNRAMENSYEESRLIKLLGHPFYVPTIENNQLSTASVHKLEEKERSRRLRHPLESQRAHEVAGLVAQAQPLGQEKAVEEKERGRRLVDTRGQTIAKQNAKNVSLMVRESSSNTLGQGPLWFSISRNSMRALEEIERTRRQRDIQGQGLAKLHAKHVSDLVLNGQVPRPSASRLEEQERQSRLFDRAQQTTAMKNARKVSGLVARHFLYNTSSRSYAQAMEESERSRRLQDNRSEYLAMSNAKKVSQMVSSRNLAKELPAFTAPTAVSTSIPIAPTPVIAAPSIPIAPPAVAKHVSIAPISAPIAPIAAPVAPIAAPVVPVAPIAPVSTVKAPVASVAPLTTSIPQSMASTIPVAPLASPAATAAVPITRQASFGQNTYGSPAPFGNVVPIDHNMPQNTHLGERERKKLAKEADRHNRKSEKDLKRAEASRLKAEKLHQKGKSDKAIKLTSKADHLILMAQHEKKWASGIKNELQSGPIIAPNAPAPAAM